MVFADGKIQPRIRGEDDEWWVDFEGAIVYRDRVRDDEIQEAKELEYRLSNWRDRLNDRLSRFAELLSAYKELCEVKIETTLTPRWDYVFTPSMGRLLTSLPSNVTSLTLDTHASRFLSREDGSEPVHICAIISQRLQDFRTVRIRMRSICPSLLKTSINSPNTTSRLKTLVIRLYFPDQMGPHDDVHDSNYPDFNAKLCYPGEQESHYHMVFAGLKLAETSPSITGLRISHRQLGNNTILVVDCKERRLFAHPYKDSRVVEGPWEDSVELQAVKNTVAF